MASCLSWILATISNIVLSLLCKLNVHMLTHLVLYTLCIVLLSTQRPPFLHKCGQCLESTLYVLSCCPHNVHIFSISVDNTWNVHFMYWAVVHTTSIFSPQVWTIFGIFYRQMINVLKVTKRVMRCFPTRPRVSTLWTVHAHTWQVHSSIFMVSSAAHKLATRTNWTALNGTKGGKHRRITYLLHGTETFLRS